MTTAREPVDELQATACSRFLNAGAVLNHMRVLLGHGDDLGYWRQSNVLAEHLTVAGCAITEAHRILLARDGIILQAPGGLSN